METNFASYRAGIETHSESLDIEQQILTDGSAVYGILISQPDGSRYRLNCKDEASAWNLADKLIHAVTGVECMREAAPVLGGK